MEKLEWSKSTSAYVRGNYIILTIKTRSVGIFSV